MDSKNKVYQKELIKLREIFVGVEDNKRKLVEGLIEDAAFLLSENYVLKQSIEKSGMVKCHPNYPDIQKPILSASQYLKNINSYAIIIKTLNGILQKNTIEGTDEFDEYLSEMKSNE